MLYCSALLEPILNRTLTNRTLRVRGGSVLHCTLRLRGNANPARLVRSLRSREQNPKIFLP